jgi:hypothetical protein
MRIAEGPQRTVLAEQVPSSGKRSLRVSKKTFAPFSEAMHSYTN